MRPTDAPVPAPLAQPHEPVPAGTVPGLAGAFAQFAPDGVTGRAAVEWASTLRIVDPGPTTRATLLLSLLYSDEEPNHCVIAREALARWIEPGEADAILTQFEPDRAAPVIIGSAWHTWPGGAIVTDWGFFLDRVARRGGLGWYTVAASLDGSWLLATGIENFVRIAVPRFDRIRGLTYAPKTRLPGGRTVPKPQCRITFDDGRWWDSDQILAPDPRAVASAFLRFLAARSGVEPTEADFIEDEPAGS